MQIPIPQFKLSQRKRSVKAVRGNPHNKGTPKRMVLGILIPSVWKWWG